MSDINENTTIKLKHFLLAVGVTWAAGTAVTVWAANQENRLSNLEAAQKATKEERAELRDSLKALADATTELNTSVKLLDQRIQIERVYETISAGAEVIDEDRPD